ncbi:MAG: lipid-A-disaccharide synthase [Methylococcales bacterium]
MNGLSDQSKATPRVMIVAGEASGDLHGAALYQALQQRLTSLDCIAMGGVAMRDTGVSIIVDSTDMGVIGVWDAITHYFPIRQAFSQVEKNLQTFSPDLLICIDYKEFNFRVAKRAKALGIKVLFYVSPQVWAWRPGRVKKYGEVIDMMAVIFPFETVFYQKYAIPVRYVGHPLTQVVTVSCGKQQAIQDAGLNATFPIIGLLPGSRLTEIKRLLPVLLDAAEFLKEAYPHAQFVLPKAKTFNDQELQAYLQNSSVDVHLCESGDYNLLQSCDIAISASGTATLELALLSIPTVIVYKVAPLTYWLAKWLVRVPTIGLPNIIAGKKIVPELIQDQANPKGIFKQVCNILNDNHAVDKMRVSLSQVAGSLGENDGIAELAKLAIEMLPEANKTHSNVKGG